MPPIGEVCKTTPALHFAVFFSVKTPWHGAEKLKQPAHDFNIIFIF